MVPREVAVLAGVFVGSESTPMVALEGGGVGVGVGLGVGVPVWCRCWGRRLARAGRANPHLGVGQGAIEEAVAGGVADGVVIDSP